MNLLKVIARVLGIGLTLAVSCAVMVYVIYLLKVSFGMPGLLVSAVIGFGVAGELHLAHALGRKPFTWSKK